MSVIHALTGKKILLGISGGIAAYKCAELTRRLKEQGADVRIVMTSAAKEFITPLTMQAVSGHAIADDLLDPRAKSSMGHIELAKWADLILLAPATANLIARLRAGLADELLTTLCLATPSLIAVAPAMNREMYQAAATQENIGVLAQRGFFIWGPVWGRKPAVISGRGGCLSLTIWCPEWSIFLILRNLYLRMSISLLLPGQHRKHLILFVISVTTVPEKWALHWRKRHKKWAHM